MIFKQLYTNQDVNTDQIKWPVGEGWQEISGPVSEFNPEKWLWISNPLWVVHVGLLFGENPHFMTSPDGETLPEIWEPINEDRGIHYEYSFPGETYAYLSGFYGFLENPGKFPFMIVGLGDSGQSALSGTLICCPQDKARFEALGWL